MDYINLPKNYLTNIAKFKNFILKKEDFNRIFDTFATNLNLLKDEILNTNNFIFQSSGNLNTFFVNIGDSTVQQKTLENLYTDVGFSVDKIFSDSIDFNSVMHIDSSGEAKFLSIITGNCITIKNNNIDFTLINAENLQNQIFNSSFLMDETITFDKFDKSTQDIFLFNVKLDKSNFVDNFEFDFNNQTIQDNQQVNDFFWSFRKSKSWFKDVCVDTKLDKMLHWIITPKALADNLSLVDENGRKHMHLICYNWSLLIKNPKPIADFYNIKTHSMLDTRGYQANRYNTSSYLAYLEKEAERAKENQGKNTGNTDYFKFLREHTFFDRIEFEACGTFDDNLFTNDCFVFSDNIPGVGIYNSYIGPMYLDKSLLSPEFRITKRMCYEAIYADHTKKHARPPLRKENIPVEILNRLRDRFGVVDDDWKWGEDGVYN